MERFQEYRQQARQHLKNADHLVTMTYPMVRDNKLLLPAAENLTDALNLSVLSVLSYELLHGRIKPFSEEQESSFRTFSTDVANRYRIDKNYIKLITDLNELVRLHKKSAVEFSRKDKFVIASETYKMIELSEASLKDDLGRARRFIESMEIIVSKDEPLPRRRV